ncbi:MAG: hypothetical protein JW857_00305, partial [Bacteroidales bacterium]|nr:hypothetical protein [Bacteroidales bacterium]
MDKLKTFIFVFLFSFSSSFAFAQNYHWWWYEIHQHDGVTPWQDYLIMSPGYFGPNAFPIPEINQGKLKSNLEIETALEEHFNSHEHTLNIYSKVFIPIEKNKIGLILSIVPIEYYAYDTVIRDQRFSRNYEGKGFASGDLYLGTQIQLLSDRIGWPDVLLGINIRSASGNEFGSARFPDSPGYYFNLSLGKAYEFQNKRLKSIRMYTDLGFYVWQTNLEAHFQNDALLYGGGIQLNTKTYSITNEIGGLYGYLNNGDRPLVYRFRWQSASE